MLKLVFEKKNPQIKVVQVIWDESIVVLIIITTTIYNVG